MSELVDRYFPVLDHGFIALVDYMGSDASVERAARVSYGKGTRSKSKTRGLIRYLMRHRHTTPFEMVEFCFHVSMPIFVARQWVRHRTANLNEYSGRYSVMPDAFYVPEEARLRKQSQTNNQGSANEVVDGAADIQKIMEEQQNQSYNNYNNFLDKDVAREVARINLPLSNYTQWYWKIDLHNLLHFLSLRMDPHSQWEIRQYAIIMAEIVKDIVPLSIEAWEDYVLNAVRLTRGDIDRHFRYYPGDTTKMSKREKTEFEDKLHFCRHGDWQEIGNIRNREYHSPEEAELRLYPEKDNE